MKVVAGFVPVTGLPPRLMVHVFRAMAALAVPVLATDRVHLRSAPTLAVVQLVTPALTCAELVKDPNRPKTKPAMAMAAMSVIAMRITVARTGETAFRLFFSMNIFM